VREEDGRSRADFDDADSGAGFTKVEETLSRLESVVLPERALGHPVARYPTVLVYRNGDGIG